MEEEEPTVQLGATYSCKRKDGSYRDGEVVKLRVNKRAGREEYFIHYAGLTRGQAEWVDKTQMVLCKPVKEEEEDVENGAEQKISEDEETTQNPRPEEDEPERKKVKVDTSGTVCKDEERTCLLCSEFCEDPVVVECGHSFCRNCINNALSSQCSFLCPGCENLITEKKSATKLPRAAISKTAVDATATLVQPLEKVKAQPLVICPEHDENLKLFCKDDGALGCIICRDSLKHSGHKFLPVANAVGLYRAELPTLVSPLEEALKEASELSNMQSEMIDQLQNTITECRQHIVSEFGNLYNFLKERREKLLEKLKKQSQCLLEEMKTNSAKMEEQRDSLKETIAVANQKVDETNVVSFLHGVKDIVKKCRVQRKAFISLRKRVIEKQLCQATFKSPIQYFTWKQLKSVVPVPENEQLLVTPNTEQVPESSTNLLMLKDSGPKEIWITGNLYIHNAFLHAEQSSFGKNLGLDEQQWVVRWMKTVRQLSLLVDLSEASRELGMPSIVYLYVGSNDLGVIPYHMLIDDFKYAINQLAKLYPETQFIFSSILPRPEWMQNGIEMIRLRYNIAIRRYAKLRRFKVASSHKLDLILLDRFYADQRFASLTFAENEMFLSIIKRSIQEAILKVSRPVTENKKPQKKVVSTGDTLIVVPGTDSAASTKEDKEEVEEKTSECLQPATEVETPEGSVAPPVDAPLPSDSESKQIWIVGNSDICIAAEQASDSFYGFNLGFKPRNWTVHWMGRVAMQWKSLVSELNNSLSRLGVPNIIFIHLGDNDVGNMPSGTLTNTIEDNLGHIRKQFPTTELIFSTMLPKAEWLTNNLEQRRQDINSALVRYAEELGFHVTIYEGIEESAIYRFKNGGSNVISEAEYDLFVKIIKDDLEMIVLKLAKAQTV